MRLTEPNNLQNALLFNLFDSSRKLSLLHSLIATANSRTALESNQLLLQTPKKMSRIYTTKMSKKSIEPFSCGISFKVGETNLSSCLLVPDWSASLGFRSPHSRLTLFTVLLSRKDVASSTPWAWWFTEIGGGVLPIRWSVWNSLKSRMAKSDTNF